MCVSGPLSVRYVYVCPTTIYTYVWHICVYYTYIYMSPALCACAIHMCALLLHIYVLLLYICLRPSGREPYIYIYMSYYYIYMSYYYTCVCPTPIYMSMAYVCPTTTYMHMCVLLLYICTYVCTPAIHMSLARCAGPPCQRRLSFQGSSIGPLCARAEGPSASALAKRVAYRRIIGAVIYVSAML
jgi:hypothetical protein